MEPSHKLGVEEQGDLQSCVPCTSQQLLRYLVLLFCWGLGLCHKFRSSPPLCLCFLSGLSFCASWWEASSQALGETSRLAQAPQDPH